jgi:hypothetical protein
VTTGLEFGVDQAIIHADLEAASQGRDEEDALDLRFEIFEQIVYQAHGPVGVVSNRAVFDADLHGDSLSQDL